jgi:HEAT repeat protein
MKPARFLGLGICLAIILVGCGSVRAGDNTEPAYDGKTLSQWKADLKHSEYAARERAVNALYKMGPDAKPAVRALLTFCEKSLATKGERKLGIIAAAAVASADRDKAGMIASLLAKNLQEPETSEMAALAMKSLGAPAVPVLVDLLKKRTCTEEAADILGNMGAAAKEAVPALAEVFKDKKGSHLTIAWALEKLGPHAKAAVPTLLAVLEDKGHRDDTRVEAAKILPKIDPSHTREAVAGLAEGLKSRDYQVRLNAASGLRGIGSEAKAAVPALLDALKDGDGAVRIYAAEALLIVDAMSAKKAVPVLRDEVQTGGIRSHRIHAAELWLLIDAPNATEAALALAAEIPWEDRTDETGADNTWRPLRPKVAAVVPGLIKALKADKASVRRNAARALGMIGAGAKEAVPALKALHKDEDEDEDVRKAAAKALGKIAP